MDISTLLTFNLALLAAILSPGPAFLVSVRMSLSAGRRAGLALGCGLGLMAATWTLMALLGLDAVFRMVPWAYGAAKALGAAYLLYIAYGMWRGARNAVEAESLPVGHAFRQGVMINLLNPKSVLFAAAVLVVIFPPDLSLGGRLLVVVNHLIVEVLFYGAVAYAMSNPAVSAQYLRAKIYLDRGAAVVLGALGLRLLFSR